ncbi:osmotically inducible protein OsmC [Variovorax paradoxus]|uniref:Ohr family peroxiredoxin n=1 Tax=Variovorax paradoxus TaxID=34073 RepID=UPI002790C6E5|nr:Ohr family peroxiredoxin [Variovorax paradoxus]MDQ0570565.1 osmotically inducible protein OsmC [Variovorax paradoxus]
MSTQKDRAAAPATVAGQSGSLQAPPVALLDKYKGQEFEGIYSTAVTVSGGEAEHGRASGVARSDDGNLNLELRLPAALGGEGGGTNPEQLFAAAYAACFHGALNLLAAKKKIPVHDATVQVSVAFGRDPVDGLFMLTADVRIDLPGVEKSVAEELVRSTERFCPYAKMARNGITSIVALAT